MRELERFAPLAGSDRHAQEARERGAGPGGEWAAAAFLLGLLARHDRHAAQAAAGPPRRPRRRARRTAPGGTFGPFRVTSGGRVSSSSTPRASRARIWPPSQLGPAPL